MNIEEIIRKNVDVLMVTNWGENSTMSLLEKSFKEAYKAGLEKAKELMPEKRDWIGWDSYQIEALQALDKELNKQ